MKSSSLDLLIIMVLVSILVACGPKQMDPIDYMNFINKDTIFLNQKKVVLDYEIGCHMRPPEFIVIGEFLKNQQDPSKISLKEDLGETEKITHIKISFESKMEKDFLKSETESEVEFSNKLYYYSTELPQTIEALSNEIPIKIAYYHFERNFGLGTKSNALIGLELSRNDFDENGLTVIFKPFFANNTKIEFTYPKGIYKDLPQPKLDL